MRKRPSGWPTPARGRRSRVNSDRTSKRLRNHSGVWMSDPSSPSPRVARLGQPGFFPAFSAFSAISAISARSIFRRIRIFRVSRRLVQGDTWLSPEVALISSNPSTPRSCRREDRERRRYAVPQNQERRAEIPSRRRTGTAGCLTRALDTRGRCLRTGPGAIRTGLRAGCIHRRHSSPPSIRWRPNTASRMTPSSINGCARSNPSRP